MFIFAKKRIKRQNISFDIKEILKKFIIVVISIMFVVVSNHLLLKTNSKNMDPNYIVEETVVHNTLDRFYIVDETANDNSLLSYIAKLSPTRIKIWKQYINQMSFFGNPYEKVFVNNKEFEAHNIIIDITYRYGYIVGALFSFWYI